MIRERLRRKASGDDGVTLVEVIVAMFIFALISVGVIQTMLSVLSVSRDSRSRQVALNLAAQEIDRSRETADLFELLTADLAPVVVNGDTFHVHRETQWVSDPNADLVCGAGGGELRYKRVNVTVTWDNMRPSTEPVRSDTVIDPRTRINDPTKGTILVTVLTGGGEGSAGVAVSASPASPPAGAVSPGAVAATDSEGCSYILRVTPGNYNVTVSRSGYVDEEQGVTSSATVSVAAGTSTNVQFQYDLAATVTTTYAPGAPGGTRIPVDLPTTYVGGVDPYVHSTTVTTTATTRTLSLHPFAAGYQAFAGSCAAADPQAWDEDVAQHLAAGLREPTFATAPGATVAASVPMGVVTVAAGGSAGGRQLRAVSVNTGADPGCATEQVLTFGNTTTTRIPTGGTMTVAMPYGSWKFQWYNGSSWVTVAQTGLTLVAPAPHSSVSGGATGTVTLDPRQVAP